jgi:hypothetical protein
MRNALEFRGFVEQLQVQQLYMGSSDAECTGIQNFYMLLWKH